MQAARITRHVVNLRCVIFGSLSCIKDVNSSYPLKPLKHYSFTAIHMHLFTNLPNMASTQTHLKPGIQYLRFYIYGH